MTRPHPVTSKPRTRKPATVLREMESMVRLLFAVTDPLGRQPYYDIVMRNIRELRRSLRDTRGKR
jgi:hypothetical protein